MGSKKHEKLGAQVRLTVSLVPSDSFGTGGIRGLGGRGRRAERVGALVQLYKGGRVSLFGDRGESRRLDRYREEHYYERTIVVSSEFPKRKEYESDGLDVGAQDVRGGSRNLLHLPPSWCDVRGGQQTIAPVRDAVDLSVHPVGMVFTKLRAAGTSWKRLSGFNGGVS